MPKKKFESIETKYYRERNQFFDSIRNIDRRSFLKISALSAGIAMAKGLLPPQSFQLIEMANGAPLKSKAHNAAVQGQAPFTVAYISDSHLYEKKLNDRFVRSILRAVDEVNQLVPQPDFVLFGGDLAQLGQKTELKLGADILKEVKAPV